jgi:hypothetical protein
MSSWHNWRVIRVLVSVRHPIVDMLLTFPVFCYFAL